MLGQLSGIFCFFLVMRKLKPIFSKLCLSRTSKKISHNSIFSSCPLIGSSHQDAFAKSISHKVVGMLLNPTLIVYLFPGGAMVCLPWRVVREMYQWKLKAGSSFLTVIKFKEFFLRVGQLVDLAIKGQATGG